MIELGYAAGRRAFSKQYEFEADVFGTYVPVAAGYDAVRRSRFFARPEPTRRLEGPFHSGGPTPRMRIGSPWSSRRLKLSGPDWGF